MVSVSKELAGAADFSAEIDTLDDALKRADVLVEEKLHYAAAQEQSQEQKRTDFAEGVAAIQADLPSWVTGVKWSNRGPGKEREEMRLTIEESVVNLRFGDRSPSSVHDDRRELRDLIIGHDFVTQCYRAGQHSQLGITPVLDPQNLLQVLNAADEVVCKQLKNDQRGRDENESLVGRAKKSIAAKLAAT